ncbi:MAG: phospholipid carrier-dependent glycosyltransferase, partial [Anaerolineales bacterium]|nr:phospholipid carrier-dependent glycosyltransferase [Anaerolineales bacterium]
GLVSVLLVAAALRWTGLDWDGYNHFHPDERYIHWVATTIERPSSWRTAFDPHRSSFNPYYWPPDAASAGIEVPQGEPRKFAYGHLPLYLGVAATRLAEWGGDRWAGSLPPDWRLTTDILNAAGMVEFRHLAAVTRALTGLVDLGTVLFVFLLGRRVFGTAVGLLAAALLAVNVMHIQLAHFFTVDPYLTFFTVGAIYFMVDFGIRVSESRPSLNAGTSERLNTRATLSFALAAVFAGLAVGTKFSAVLLFLPLAVAAWLVVRERWWLWWLTAVLVAFLAFFLTNPFAVLDWTCELITEAMPLGPVTIPAINWGNCYLDNITTQSVMVNGGGNIPFTRQYAGTLPYLYPIEMQLKWGMGWLLGLAAFIGFGWAVWDFIRRLEIRDWRFWRRTNRQLPVATLLLLSWAVPFFLVTGSFFVKFMRYLQPLTPFLMIFAAALLWRIRQRWLRWLMVSIVLGGTAVYAFAFVNIYSVPHPWVTASEWIYANVEPGDLILSEQWDDALPASLIVDGKARLRAEYENAELTWLTGVGENDGTAKLAGNLDLLAQADYVTLVSNRVYGVVPRLPAEYPLSSQYHQLLLDGRLGYDLVSVNGRYPHLFLIFYRPDTFGWPGLTPPEGVEGYLAAEMPGLIGGRVDESFVVYDQPLTMIFKNNGRLSAAEMERLFTVPPTE